MRANKRLQRSVIARSIKRRGYSPDLFDLDSNIDSRLSLPENLNAINTKFGFNKKTTGLNSSAERVLKAEELHERRSSKSRQMDDRRRARRIFDPYTLTAGEFKKWRRNPNRFDIEGID